MLRNVCNCVGAHDERMTPVSPQEEVFTNDLSEVTEEMNRDPGLKLRCHSSEMNDFFLLNILGFSRVQSKE